MILTQKAYSEKVSHEGIPLGTPGKVLRGEFELKANHKSETAWTFDKWRASVKARIKKKPDNFTTPLDLILYI